MSCRSAVCKTDVNEKARELALGYGQLLRCISQVGICFGVDEAVIILCLVMKQPVFLFEPAVWPAFCKQVPGELVKRLLGSGDFPQLLIRYLRAVFADGGDDLMGDPPFEGFCLRLPAS